MKQIIGKRFIYINKRTSINDSNKELLTVVKSLPNYKYQVATKDSSLIEITEKDLFENYTAIRPSHVITYHKTKAFVDAQIQASDLNITIAKYTDEDEDIILIFNLFNWLMDAFVKGENGWYLRDRIIKDDYIATTRPLDSNNSPILELGEEKEIYYCYLDSACGIPAITGLIPEQLIPYLYGKDNKLENYNDAFSKLGISVKDLIGLNNINDKILKDIRLPAIILDYLGYVDVQFYYDRIVRENIKWTADKLLKTNSNELKWEKTMLNRKSRINNYPGMPYLSLQGVDFDRPITYRKRTETDEEIKNLITHLSANGEFLMQYYFIEDCSILLVTYSCKQPINDQPAFTEEEMAKFIKHKR